MLVIASRRRTTRTSIETRLRRGAAGAGRRVPAGGAAAREPRDAGPLRARLDVQGRDGRRPRSTAAAYTLALDVRGPRATARSTASASSTTPTRGRRPATARVNLGQAIQNSINSVFCNIGKDARRRDARRVCEAVRLLRAAAARDPGERAGAERAVPGRRGCSIPRTTTRSTRAASRSGRSACW